MKKQTLRLSLHRETLVHLDGRRVSAAAGTPSGATCLVTCTTNTWISELNTACCPATWKPGCGVTQD